MEVMDLNGGGGGGGEVNGGQVGAIKGSTVGLLLPWVDITFQYFHTCK